MRRRLALLAVVVAAGCASVGPRPTALPPNQNLRADGMPAIPLTIRDRTAAYTEFNPTFGVGWHPTRDEILVARRDADTTQLFAVTAPRAAPRALTHFSEPVRFGMYLRKEPDTLIFVRDRGGNEETQLFTLAAGAADALPLMSSSRRHSLRGINSARDRLLVTSTDLDRTGRRDAPTLDVVLLDPFDAAGSRTLATLPGTGWGSFEFSPDDAQLAMVEFKSVNETFVWLMDVRTGKRSRVFPSMDSAMATSVATGRLAFAGDARGLFLATDRDGEFARLAYLDLRTGQLEYFGVGADADVEHIDLSPDRKTLAVITNEAGTSVLRLYDAATRRALNLPVMPSGQVLRLAWNPDSRRLALTINSARSPGDVYVIDLASSTLTRWTESSTGSETSHFPDATTVSWKSFDGLQLSGLITRPPAKWSGKRPVLIQIHGGPEGQSRPGFMGRWNYFVNELGIAVLSPNVRGSTGYGKRFVALDNGTKRVDSVKDIGALLDWIATQPDLDPTRVLLYGASYGGYMVLSVAATYPERIAGAIDVVGIANFVSFLENTESYRRDLRRVEYGDERDPAMRAFLTSISPVNHAHRIRVPLFVVHGRNDPRVPYTEAEQIVTAARSNGARVWYLLADNEGHGFARKANADFLFYAMVAFLEETLLRK